MEREVREVPPRELGGNPFDMIGRGWMLVTAGTMGSWNTMTASWGGFGVLWNKDVVFCFVRPTRHTFSFLEANECFTLSFFGEGMRGALNVCGSRSGRDTDKAAAAGLSPIPVGASVRGAPGEGAERRVESVTFAEARLAILARKLWSQDVEPGRFLAPEIEGFYPEKDYHRLFAGEILSCGERAGGGD